MAHAAAKQLRHDFGGALRHGVEQRVAAADVGRAADAPCRRGRAACTSCTSQGRPQFVLFVPGDSTAQNTQCSMWNIGMCWWMTTSSHVGRHRGDQVEQLLAVQIVRRA